MNKVFPFDPKQQQGGRELSQNKSGYQEQMDISSRKMGQTQMSANPSLIQISTEMQFSQMKVEFLGDLELIHETKIVEKLGSTLTIQQKKTELEQFEVIFQEFLLYLINFRNIIIQIVNESELQGRLRVEHYEKLVKDVQDIEIAFLELTLTSSLRYLNKCCQIFDLDNSQINLEYPIKRWGKELRDFLKKEYLHNLSQNKKYFKDNKKSFCSSICGCFFSGNESQKIENDNKSSQKLNTQTSIYKRQTQPQSIQNI